MSALRRHAPPSPPDELSPEELRLLELLAQADAERDYLAAKVRSEESGADRPLRPL